MELLLSIRTIDAQYEMHIEPAKLEAIAPEPSHQVIRDKGGLKIQSRPPKLLMDTYEARASMGQKTPARLTQESSDQNLQTALEATAQIVRDGNRLADPLSGASPAALAQERVLAGIAAASQTVIAAIPSVPAQISLEPGSFSMDYTPDQLTFDWDTESRPAMEFTPAQIRVSITERPRLEIEYIGKPLYVPPSASPDYEESRFSKSV